jgi:hypothetical protein
METTSVLCQQFVCGFSVSVAEDRYSEIQKQGGGMIFHCGRSATGLLLLDQRKADGYTDGHASTQST